jgi:hypothetical protein
LGHLPIEHTQQVKCFAAIQRDTAPFVIFLGDKERANDRPIAWKAKEQTFFVTVAAKLTIEPEFKGLNQPAYDLLHSF